MPRRTCRSPAGCSGSLACVRWPAPGRQHRPGDHRLLAAGRRRVKFLLDHRDLCLQLGDARASFFVSSDGCFAGNDHLAFTIRTTWRAALSGSARMSVSHNRTTAQPNCFNWRLLRLSRSMLDSILATQYCRFDPRSSFCLRSPQCRPCQKSPSQNTATRLRRKTTSGRPTKVRKSFRKRSPSLHSRLLNRRSHRESADRFRDATRLAVADAARRPSNRGVLTIALLIAPYRLNARAVEKQSVPHTTVLSSLHPQVAVLR